jgi:exosome complex component RRP42
MSFQNEYILKHVERGMRLDGRKADESRKIEIEVNPIEQAEGSARVKIGNTEVIAGVKIDVGEPFPDTPEKGVLIVNSEFSPLASPDFELGPPREKAVELSRVVDRGIRESKCMDVEKLCIEKGEKVWLVFIDIQPLTADGNLIDAAGIAAITALLSAKMPKYDKKEEKVDREAKGKSLPLNDSPVPVTMALIGGKLLLDPSLEEENAMEARLTVSTKTDGNVCAFQKGGSGFLTLENIREAMDISMKKGKEIREMIKKTLKT